MDIFVEYIVKKKRKTSDRVVVVLTVLFGILIILALLNMPLLLGPSSSIVMPIVMLGVIFGSYYLITSRNVEFEYAVTNGELDIDKIVSRKRRKRVFSGDCKDFEILAKINSDKYNKEIKDIPNRMEFVSSMDSPDVYFAVLKYKGQRTVVFIEPNEKMLNAFKTYISKKVF